MTNKTELLPCPFCGGPGKLCVADYVHDDGRPWPIVECDTCHGWVPASVWNTRAAPVEDVRTVGEEPVAWLTNGGKSFYWPSPDIEQAPGDIALYRHPQRPVVLPERKAVRWDIPEGVARAEEWNACIDEFERLNK